MFTGIVRDVGRIADVAGGEDGVRLVVQVPATMATVRPGDSLGVNGVCLTAESVEQRAVTVHAVPETLRRTTLGSLARGDAVNLEPALRVGDPLGGHYVQGHVDGVGRIESVEAEGEGLRVVIEAPEDVLRYCVEKGSIAVDGVSLTVAELFPDSAFGVALVPYTIEATTLSELVPGRRVNLEVDVLAKYVERLAQR